MMHLVNKIKEVKPYKITLKFNTSELITIDLEDKIKNWSKSPGSIYKKLLDHDYFKTVKYNRQFPLAKNHRQL